MVADPRIGVVVFTGSVAGGHAVTKAASSRFVRVVTELGGKDPAYVRPDADLNFAIENVMDGALFNSGQSCCSVERIYVHKDVYQSFVDGAVELTNSYVLGNPLDPSVTLGPLVRTRAADFVRDQIREAIGQGAQALIDPAHFQLIGWIAVSGAANPGERQSLDARDVRREHSGRSSALCRSRTMPKPCG